MKYETPEIHPYRFITDIETDASTVTTVTVDTAAAIERKNAENEAAGKQSAAQEVFSFEF